MERRKFLQLSAAGSMSSMLLNGNLVRAFSQTKLLDSIPAEVVDGRILVMVQLRGGNDGLNTLIPKNQYDEYVSLRPTVHLKKTGNNAAINLDDSLSTNDQMYIHPSLNAFKELYEDGKLNIIHGVGYPLTNKSHFAGRAMMFKGEDGTVEHANKDSGWMARYLQSGFDHNDYADPLGIQLGSTKPSLGFHSSHEHKVDVNLSKQDIGGYHNIISSIGNESLAEVPNSDFGHNIQFIQGIEQSANSYAQRISEVFDNGSNSTVEYPEENASNEYVLPSQLRTVARMIKGGSKTKIFLVSIDGFDNHDNQVVGNNTHQGKHADLLREVGDSIKAFQDDLEAMGIAEKVITATFTEFGRKPRENGNLGTDHGNLGPMFIVGKHVNPGIHGTNLDLSGVVKHYDENQLQYDYRAVFGSIITQFMGANSNTIDNTEFSDFMGSNLEVIASEQRADDNLSVPEFDKDSFTVAPNPVSDIININFDSLESFRGHVVCYDMQG